MDKFTHDYITLVMRRSRNNADMPTFSKLYPTWMQYKRTTRRSPRPMRFKGELKHG